MSNIVDSAVAWAVAIANDNSHGYDQARRQGPDYDCSSLVINAYNQAGLKVKSAGASYTGDMVSAFLKCGFTNVTSKVNLSTGEGLKKGDVIWRKGHVGMMANPTSIIEAHANEDGNATGGKTGDQTGHEIDICVYKQSELRPWTKCLRYKVSGTDDGQSTISKSDLNVGNRYLTLEEMQINAQYILNYLCSRGWSKEAVCAILGNMQTESTINPEIWQSLKEGSTNLGFGLVQWTPATKLIEWAEDRGLDYKDIDTQLLRIIYEKENGGQYYSTDEYPLSFEEFSTSIASPEYLAKAFLYNYEKPSSYETAEKRAEQARYWYDLLTVGYNSSNNDNSMSTPDRGTNHLSRLLLYLIATDRF